MSPIAIQAARSEVILAVIFWSWFWNVGSTYAAFVAAIYKTKKEKESIRLLRFLNNLEEYWHVNHINPDKTDRSTTLLSTTNSIHIQLGIVLTQEISPMLSIAA